MAGTWRWLRFVVVVGATLGNSTVAPLLAVRAEAVDSAGTVTFGAGDLQALVPGRVLDTREGIGAPVGPVGPGSTTVVKVAGHNGVPSVGAGAVVLNVTVTDPTAPSFVTVYPTGAPRPTASNLNFVAGQTVPNLVVVKLGVDGSISLFNLQGSVHLIADVAGWFPEGSGLRPLVPARLLDTREGLGAPAAPVGPNSTVTLHVTGRGGVPDTGVGAVVLNVTVTGPSMPGFVTVYPTGAPRPTASNLNFVAGQTVPNLVIAKLGADGNVDLYNLQGTTDLVADVAGWFPLTSAFTPLNPGRMLDTREGIGAPIGTVGPGSVTTLHVTGRNGVPDQGVGAVVLNVTVTEATAPSFVTVYPTAAERPTASNLNFVAGQTVPNLVIAKVGAGGNVDLFNLQGSLHLIADVAGWFSTGGSDAVHIDLKPGTVLAGAGDVVAVTGDGDTGGTVTLSASADLPPVGGHLAVFPGPITPSGMSGVVTGIALNGDGTATIALAPMNLQDAFNAFTVHTASTAPASPPIQSFSTGSGLERVQTATACAGTLGGGPQISFHDFGGDFDFDLVGQTARLVLRGTVSVYVQLSVAVACSVEFPLPSFLAFLIGPTVVEGAAVIKLSITGTVSGGFTVDIPVQVGASYDHGAVTNLTSISAHGQGQFSPATASISAAAEGQVSDKLFGIAGLSLSLGPEVTASLGFQGTRFCAKVEAQFAAAISAELGRWGVGWSFELARFIRGPLEIWKNAGCDPPGRWVGTVQFHNVYNGIITTAGTVTLASDLWQNEVAPWDGFNGLQHASVSGVYTYDDPGVAGQCGSTHGTSPYSYDRTHYDTEWNGTTYPSLGGWFQLLIDGSDVSVGGLQDVANFFVLPVTGVGNDCLPFASSFLSQPLYPPLSVACNDALDLGLTAEIQAILDPDPGVAFGALSGANSITSGSDACDVTWNLTKLPNA